MENEKIMFSPISLDELTTIIRDIVRQELSCFADKINLKEDMPKYLTRKEMAKELNISLPSLNKYTRLRLIPFYKIGNRIYFEPNEVYEFLKKSRKI